MWLVGTQVCAVSLLLDDVCDLIFFFKQKTAYEMRISDWSSDVCSSDLAWKEERCLKARADPRKPTTRRAIRRRPPAASAGRPPRPTSPPGPTSISRDRKSVV